MVITAFLHLHFSIPGIVHLRRHLFSQRSHSYTLINDSLVAKIVVGFISKCLISIRFKR